MKNATITPNELIKALEGSNSFVGASAKTGQKAKPFIIVDDVSSSTGRRFLTIGAIIDSETREKSFGWTPGQEAQAYTKPAVAQPVQTQVQPAQNQPVQQVMA